MADFDLTASGRCSMLLKVDGSEVSVALDPKRKYGIQNLSVTSAGATSQEPIFYSVTTPVSADFGEAENEGVIQALGVTWIRQYIIFGVKEIRFKTAGLEVMFNINRVN